MQELALPVNLLQLAVKDGTQYGFVSPGNDHGRKVTLSAFVKLNPDPTVCESLYQSWKLVVSPARKPSNGV